MICDWLTVTMAKDNHQSVSEELLPLIAQLGVLRLVQDTYHFDNGGSLSLRPNYGVSTISASGSAIAALRSHGLWGAYLGVLSDYPLNVTRLDAAHDIPYRETDGPARYISKLNHQAKRGDVLFLGKKLNPQKKRLFVETDRFGNETGTIYLGPKKPQVVQIRAYDKSHELYKFKRLETDPLLRVEVQAGRKAGCTLRDAYDPTAFFWHHVGNILDHPDDVPDWFPNRDPVSFPKTVSSLPAASLKRLVETSDLIPRIAALSAQVGPNGSGYALRLIETQLRRELSNQSPPVDHSLRSASNGDS